ncbi:kinase-like domain-containing protein [Irpex lacteus]|nr:kinase-like domain-containing protein [Irpex lacteus]
MLDRRERGASKSESQPVRVLERAGQIKTNRHQIKHKRRVAPRLLSSSDTTTSVPLPFIEHGSESCLTPQCVRIRRAGLRGTCCPVHLGNTPAECTLQPYRKVAGLHGHDSFYFLFSSVYLSFSQSWFARSLQGFALYCSPSWSLDLSTQHLSSHLIPLTNAFDSAPLQRFVLPLLPPFDFYILFARDALLNCFEGLRRRGILSLLLATQGLSPLAQRVFYSIVHTPCSAAGSAHRVVVALLYSPIFWLRLLGIVATLALITLCMFFSLGFYHDIFELYDNNLPTVVAIRRRLASSARKLSSFKRARCWTLLNSYGTTLAVLSTATLGVDYLSWHFWRRYRPARSASTCLLAILGLLCIIFILAYGLAYMYDIGVALFTLKHQPWLPPGYSLIPAFDAKYELCDPLGRGTNGFVLRVRQRSDGRYFACKFLDMRYAHLWPIHPKLGRVPPEVAIAADVMHHDNIIKIIEAYSDGKYCYLIQELFGDVWQPRCSKTKKPSNIPSGRSLAEYILHHNETIPPDVAHKIFTQLVSAVAHLHSKGVAHCDIKPSNILIDRDANIRLIDLGSGLRCSPSPSNPHRSRSTQAKYYLGTKSYMPPETLGDRNALCQPFLGDVWALGVTLYALTTGILRPFTTNGMSLGGVESMYKFDKLRGTEAVVQVLPLLHLCLDVHPSKRVTMDDLARLFKV